MLIRRGALRELWESTGRPRRADIAPRSSDRTFWDGIDRAARRAVLDEASALAAAAWPQPLLSQWSDYARSGDRLDYETAVFERSRRVRLAVLAAAIEPTEARLREAADGLWLVCEQSTWCWPAHDDAFERGLMVPDVERPYLDLGAGEKAALIAWSDLLLGDGLDQLSPGLRARMASETRERVLIPFVERRDWHWEGRVDEDGHDHVHNWAPWIHGNLLPAAIVFADEPLRDRVIGLAVDGIDRYLAQLPVDGAIDEGFAYWWQGAARAFDALALLDPLSGGAIGASALDGELSGLRELALFPQRMQLGEGWFASFSDAGARSDGDLPWHSLFRAARLTGASQAAGFAVGRRAGLCGLDHGVAAGLGRMLAELADPQWREAEQVPGAAPLPERVWLPSIGVGLRRELSGSASGLAVLIKGGHNDENHNHNDLGSFAVAVDGVPLLPDLGRAEYNADTFSERRYDLWHVRSVWHSTPQPRGVEQRAGREWRAPLEELPDGWRCDLSDAFPGLYVPWTRTVRLNAGIVRIADESPALDDDATRVTVICAGEPERGDAGLRVPGRHGSRDLLLEHDPAVIEIETIDVDDPLLRASWGRRVSRLIFQPTRTGGPVTKWELRARVG